MCRSDLTTGGSAAPDDRTEPDDRWLEDSEPPDAERYAAWAESPQEGAGDDART